MSDTVIVTNKGSTRVDNTTTQLTYIQILRFVASTLVVIFHAIGTGGYVTQHEDSKVIDVLAYGGHGVDLFFVISGFIIYYSTHTLVKTPQMFLWRRAERIIPIYWFMYLLLIVIYVVAPSAFKSTEWFNFRFMFESMFFVSFIDGHLPAVFVGWSLEYEMFFYLSVSFLLLRKEKAWDELIVIFALLVMLNAMPVPQRFETVHGFFTNPLILEFIFGIIVARIFIGKHTSKLAMAFVVVSLLSVAWMDHSNRAIAAGLPSTILVAAGAYLSKSRSRPSWFEKALARLGDASYSTYLLQIFVISAAGKYLPRIYPLSWGMFIATTTLLTISSGYILFMFVERPLLNMCRRFRPGQARRASPPLSASATSIDR